MNSTLLVSFTGLDGSGKSACLDALIERFEKDLRILRVGVGGFESFHAGRSTQVFDSGRMEALGDRVRGTPLYGFWLLCNLLQKFVRMRRLIRAEDHDVVFTEADTLIHPAAYIKYHFPRSTRFLGANLRFTLANFLFGSPGNTLIFYLSVEPETAIERCERRAELDGVEIEPHENVGDLTAIKRELDEIISIASRKGYDVAELDTEGISLDSVIRRAEDALRSRLTCLAAPNPNRRQRHALRALPARDRVHVNPKSEDSPDQLANDH